VYYPAYQMTATHHANMALPVHERINDLHRRAERLAPAVAASALSSGCTDQTRASYATLGPRQARAWDMVAEAHAWNAISDDAVEQAVAELAEHTSAPYHLELRDRPVVVATTCPVCVAARSQCLECALRLAAAGYRDLRDEVCPCCLRQMPLPGVVCADCDDAGCAGSPFATVALPYPYCAFLDASPLTVP
jgi:hypothetical protein